MAVFAVFMPLINKAAVIFISPHLQTHLWYVTWQHKLVKSARSYQSEKSHIVEPPIWKSGVSCPLLSGGEPGRVLELGAGGLQPHLPSPLLRMPAATAKHRKSKFSANTAHLSKRMGSHSHNIPFAISFTSPFSTAFFPPFQFHCSPCLLLRCCRLGVWQVEAAPLISGS